LAAAEYTLNIRKQPAQLGDEGGVLLEQAHELENGPHVDAGALGLCQLLAQRLQLLNLLLQLLELLLVGLLVSLEGLRRLTLLCLLSRLRLLGLRVLALLRLRRRGGLGGFGLSHDLSFSPASRDGER
jgi:hypothetical protein